MPGGVFMYTVHYHSEVLNCLPQKHDFVHSDGSNEFGATAGALQY